MKLRRVNALELLQTLRALDGITVNGQLQPFKFDPPVIEKIIENILALRKVKDDADVFSDELQEEAIREHADAASPTLSSPNSRDDGFLAGNLR
jgi:hypothetical protein